MYLAESHVLNILRDFEKFTIVALLLTKLVDLYGKNGKPKGGGGGSTTVPSACSTQCGWITSRG